MGKMKMMAVIAAVAAVGGGFLVYKCTQATKDTDDKKDPKSGTDAPTSGVGYTPVGYKALKQQVEVYEKPQLIQ